MLRFRYKVRKPIRERQGRPRERVGQLETQEELLRRTLGMGELAAAGGGGNYSNDRNDFIRPDYPKARSLELGAFALQGAENEPLRKYAGQGDRRLFVIGMLLR